MKKCSRCNGTGFIKAYSHIDGGRCMACKGRGSKVVEVAPIDPEVRVILGSVEWDGKVGQVMQGSEHGRVVRVVVTVGTRVYRPRFGARPCELAVAVLAAFPQAQG